MRKKYLIFFLAGISIALICFLSGSFCRSVVLKIKHTETN